MPLTPETIQLYAEEARRLALLLPTATPHMKGRYRQHIRYIAGLLIHNAAGKV